MDWWVYKLNLGYTPDFGMIIIGSNNGVIGMTKEHIMIT